MVPFDMFRRLFGGNKLSVKPLKAKYVERQVLEAFADQLGLDYGTVSPEAKLADLGLVDELDLIELAMEIEDRFPEVDIDDGIAGKFETVRDWINYTYGLTGAYSESLLRKCG